MKKSCSTLFSTLSLLLFSTIAHAQWYEVTGSALIVATKEQARMNALEDAVYQAAKYSGADIGNLSVLKPYLEEQRKEYQFSGHEIHDILVTNEKDKGGKITMKVLLDIYPSANSCHLEQYKKTILISKIDIESPQQAVMGSIFELGDDFSQLINKQVEKESYSFISLGTTHYTVDKKQPEMVKMLAQDHDAQYIINGHITDLTSTVDNSDKINRQFALEIGVLDGKTGHEVYKKNYREVARWPFAKTSKVDTKGARFWASSYGDMMLRVSRDVMLDLEAKLSCKMTLPSIVMLNNNTATMDLGRIHGVREGDRLKLWHNGSFIDQNGLPRNKISSSDISLTVTRVYEKEAELRIDQPELARSIQIGDVLQKESY